MAGSGLPPLPNIPYCCLPQESGPCLSASVGDRPLRSPTHRGLGGPLHRQLPNGTHARPPAPEGYRARGMPLARRTAHHPAFPPAVRLRRVGCIRVAHPSATLTSPEGTDPVRFACIRPAASVHPEPGSNSSLYYCFTLNLLCISGSAFVLYCVPFPVFASRLHDGCEPFSCAGLKLSKNLCFLLPFKLTSLFCGSGLQRYDLFIFWQAIFSIIFENKSNILIIKKINLIK